MISLFINTLLHKCIRFYKTKCKCCTDVGADMQDYPHSVFIGQDIA